MEALSWIDKFLLLATETETIIGASVTIAGVIGGFLKQFRDKQHMAKLLDLSSENNSDLMDKAVKNGLSGAVKSFKKFLKKT